MKNYQPWPKISLAFFVAWLAGTVLGSLIQTQFNLLALQSLGVTIEPGVRLATSWQDLLNFGPLYALLLAPSFLVSQAAALGLGRMTRTHWQPLWCAVAATLGLWLTFALANALAPMPTLIAATRSVQGTAAMLASAAFAGWLFGRLVIISKRKSDDRIANPLLLVLLGIGGLVTDFPAQAAEAIEHQTGYRIETLAEGLEHPWDIAFLPDGGALVSERAGRLRLIDSQGQLVPEPLAGLPELFVSGQGGLHDILLAADFKQSQVLYFSYVCGTPDANHTCLARARLGKQRLENVEEIFRAQPAKSGAAHFGARLSQLPDETLILTLGDGFDYREQAQKLGNHIGTIVRLNPDGSAPANNPFVDLPGALPEIYSYGHRNPQGLFYDSERNRLISHEHGPRGGDEINVIKPGRNYGWPVVTHGLDYTYALVTPFTEHEGMVAPLLHWTPSIAPSGLTVYRGELFPEWQGSLLVGGLASRQVHRVVLTDGGAKEKEILFSELGERIRSVKTGPDGAIYLLTDSPQGKVLRVVPNR